MSRISAGTTAWLCSTCLSSSRLAWACSPAKEQEGESDGCQASGGQGLEPAHTPSFLLLCIGQIKEPKSPCLGEKDFMSRWGELPNSTGLFAKQHLGSVLSPNLLSRVASAFLACQSVLGTASSLISFDLARLSNVGFFLLMPSRILPGFVCSRWEREVPCPLFLILGLLS